LEIDGVLASWAVPKGPTLDPKARRLAVHVEDHPIEYAEFEGVIPAGQYGGGDVIVWDQGTWQPAEGTDPAAAVADGNLHFDLQGEKLAGRFVLVRRGDDRSGKQQWMLLHKNDEYAEPGWDAEDLPLSVKTGRTNDEVAEKPDSLWRSDLPAAQAQVSTSDSATRRRSPAGERKKTSKGERRRRSPASRQAPTAAQLTALDDLGQTGNWVVGGQDVRLTHLDKVLFPAHGRKPQLTKRDLIRYYAQIAPVLLPYLAERPVNMHRFPDGVDKPGFWQKEAPAHAPDWLRQWHYEQAQPGDSEHYIVVDTVATLVWLANYGAIELHAWTSRVRKVERPTWVLFDIDPGPETSFDEVLALARLHRAALDHFGLEGRPKVSGQRGIQIWVPIAARCTYAETRGWAETVSKAVGNTLPELVSWEWHKEKRRGLARLDYTQNVINKTLVAPYSVRPRPGAPVSVPLEWEELDDPDLRPDRWNVQTVLDRIATTGDPFAPLLQLKQRLPRL
jgi:bifunctional non-homologous end joining protein LigD